MLIATRLSQRFILLTVSAFFWGWVSGAADDQVRMELEFLLQEDATADGEAAEDAKEASASAANKRQCHSPLDGSPSPSRCMGDASTTAPRSRDASPMFDVEAATPTHYQCPPAVAATLRHVQFQPSDLWEGYQLYCTGSYYKQRKAQHGFDACKLATVMRQCHELPATLKWGPALEKTFRAVYPCVEAFGAARFPNAPSL